jgi:hypothetical protein
VRNLVKKAKEGHRCLHRSRHRPSPSLAALGNQTPRKLGVLQHAPTAAETAEVRALWEARDTSSHCAASAQSKASRTSTMKTSTAPGGSMTRYRDTATGETYDEDAMEDLLFVDIGNLEAQGRERIDFGE